MQNQDIKRLRPDLGLAKRRVRISSYTNRAWRAIEETDLDN